MTVDCSVTFVRLVSSVQNGQSALYGYAELLNVMIEKDTGSVALNWSPAAYLSIAPARLAARSWFFFESPSSSPLPQPASARVAAPAAAASTWRLDSSCMAELPFGGGRQWKRRRATP